MAFREPFADFSVKSSEVEIACLALEPAMGVEDDALLLPYEDRISFSESVLFDTESPLKHLVVGIL